MKTLEELTAAVEAAEAQAEEMAAIGMLQARLAGVKSRYKAFDLEAPAEVHELDAELSGAVTEQKAEMEARAEKLVEPTLDASDLIAKLAKG